MANQTGARLAGTTAVITGGGSGIGAACAVALAAEGCQVVISGRRAEPLEATAARVADPGSIHPVTADVGNPQSVEALFATAVELCGPVDLLINNAGINIPRRAFAEMSIADWDRVLRINASGAYYCMREVVPSMRERGGGLIINISSVAGIRASELGGAAYTASKFAMAALGRTVELEELQHGIRVTNIYPGEVETPILEDRPQPVSAEHRARILQPEDVAAAVLMVACLPARASVPELVIKPASQPLN